MVAPWESTIAETRWRWSDASRR